jgi:HAD superfamily hydrolase (TIGR01450 family)
MKNLKTNKIKFIIFDLDGVFYRDSKPILGGKEIIQKCEENGIDYCFLTNNSSYPLSVYIEKLFRCGIIIDESKIVTTTILVEQYLKEQKIENIYVLGSLNLKENLYTKFTKTEKYPEALILGMNDNITLLEISQAINIIKNDTKIIAANPDKLIPKQNGFALECGVIIDIIKDVTGKEIQVVGKPDSFAYNHILKKFNLTKKEVLMVGDTYETDILGAINTGINAAWVKTGNKLPKEIKNSEFMRFESLYDLIGKL